jgi:SAM-dependent methyltransferase
MADWTMAERDLEKAALRGEPSYVWRAGQERRLQMIRQAAGERLQGHVLENGCGVGTYINRLASLGGKVIGLEYDHERAQEALALSEYVLQAEGEALPFTSKAFDAILSNEVLEHVRDDRAAVHEMVRTLRPGGRLVLFVPNRGYPFETHGVFWRGRYRFGNIPFINYLPRSLRDRLAPHVRVYTSGDLERLFTGLPVRFVERRIIFGAYDNIIARWPRLGRWLRGILQGLERTPAQAFGLSHFWVVERAEGELPS